MTTPSASPVFNSVRKAGGIVVTDIPKLDVESYIHNYSGRTRFARLHFIGTHSTALCFDALKAAVAEAQQGRDVARYKIAVAELALASPSDDSVLLDGQWVESTSKRNKAETDRLEAELKQYKNNLVKESIRMGNEDLGRHYQSIGDLPSAYEAFGRMRADISVQRHVVDVSKHQISVALEQKNWILVMSNVQRAQAIATSPEEDKAIQPFLAVAEGLAHLALTKYDEAARCFLSTDAGMGSNFSETASPNDVAIYGGLCALASMEREQLQKSVLDRASFRTYLELEPHIRRAITFFVNGRYSACLAILENYRSDYLLDLYLAPHIPDIYDLIRSKAIVQYFIPFSCVTLDSLEQQFAIPGKSLQDELVSMIKRGDLEARIDTIDRLLLAVTKDPRATLQAETLARAQAYEREMRRRIQRINILDAGLDIKPPKKGQGQPEGYPSGMEDVVQNMRGGYQDGRMLGGGNDSGYE